MRKATTIAILILAFVASAAELIKNGGFEQGTHVLPFGKDIVMPVYWNHWNPGSKFELIENEHLARSGTKCVRLATRSNAKRGDRVLSESFSVDPNQRYLVQVWAKSAETDGAMKVTVHEYAYMPQRQLIGSQVLTPKSGFVVNGEWRLFHAVFQPRRKRGTTRNQASLAISMTENVFIDDVSVQPHHSESFPERFADFQLLRKIADLESSVTDDETKKNKYSERLQALKRNGEVLAKQLQAVPSPEEEFDLRRQFDQLKNEYQHLRHEIAFDGVTF